jgi:hypothetical protein
VLVPPGSEQERRPGVSPDADAQQEIVRLALEDGANKSVKRAILTCLIILVARRRRAKAAIASGVAGGIALAHWWHPVWSLLSHIVH